MRRPGDNRGRWPIKARAVALLAVCLCLAACAGWPRADARVSKVAANPAAGFAYDYYLYLPDRIARPALLVIPNNSGFVDDDIAAHERSVQRDIALFGKRLAAPLEAALLMPVFPRSRTHAEVYTHALDRDTLQSAGARLDAQLLAMLDDARRSPALSAYRLDGRNYLFGFSAAGMFVNRFALLHPDAVRAVACGAPGGWPIAPLGAYRGMALSYPVGIADLPQLAGQALDLDAFKTLAQFFFIGADDGNDSLMYTDGYDVEQKETVFALFGDTPAGRFAAAEALYREIGANARFTVYRGVGHTLTDAMLADAVAFFKQAAPAQGR
jgi:dienelactone hydrolase